MLLYRTKRIFFLLLAYSAFVSSVLLFADSIEGGNASIPMTINLQELDKARVGFSSYPISENNPAPAVSLARTSMSTEFGVDANGNVVASGKTTIYAFWEAFTASKFKIKLKFIKDEAIGSVGEMRASEDKYVDWSCNISGELKLSNAVIGYQGREETDSTLEAIYKHECTLTVDESSDWVKSGFVRLDFFTEGVKLNELASNPYYGSFQIRLQVED